MNQRVTLAITAIVAAAALATVAFAVPQQAMAGGHHNHHDHNSNNGIKVDQQVNQLNNCTSAECVNLAENQAHIGH
jgi:archaellin